MSELRLPDVRLLRVEPTVFTETASVLPGMWLKTCLQTLCRGTHYRFALRDLLQKR